MGDIHFTQYLMPGGRTKDVIIDRPKSISDKADQLLKHGYKFECEMLQTRDISLTIVKNGEDVDGEICPNGPEVPKAIDRLIERTSLNFKEPPNGH